MSCLCVVCLPCCVLLLDSSSFVAIVRIRSSTLGSSSWLQLLPSGISGKMTATPDLTTIIAMLVASFYCYVALPITCYSSLPKLPWTSNLWHLPSKPLFGYVTALLSPSYSVVSCRWSWTLLLVGTWTCGDMTISLILLNASIYLAKGGRLGLLLGVLFHSCLPSFRHTGVMFLDFAFLRESPAVDPPRRHFFRPLGGCQRII